MSLIYLIGFIILCIVLLDSLNNRTSYINYIILKQKTEIVLINNICLQLSLSYINYDIIQFKYHYIRISFIIVFINIILFISFIPFIILTQKISYDLIILIHMIMVLSLFICLLINYFCLKYIKQTEKAVKIKETEIKIKKEEINNIYITKIFDINNDIEYINNSIDEYIVNYSYLNSLSNKKNKETVINEIKNTLIITKTVDLTNIMNTNLKDITIITPEIVKNELIKMNENLEAYKNQLETKIKMI